MLRDCGELTFEKDSVTFEALLSGEIKSAFNRLFATMLAYERVFAFVILINLQAGSANEIRFVTRILFQNIVAFLSCWFVPDNCSCELFDLIVFPWMVKMIPFSLRIFNVRISTIPSFNAKAATITGEFETSSHKFSDRRLD